MEKPDCYKCKHIGNIPGSAHVSCNHPAFNQAHGNPMGELLGVLASFGRTPPIQATSGEIKVVGHPWGIKNGWFNHPYNFDPTWLIECNGFEKKER